MSQAVKTPTKYQHIFKTVYLLNKLEFKKLVTPELQSIKFSFEWYLGSSTLLLWFSSYLRLKFDKILTIQTLLITFKPP